ncbi:MAG: C10 family peptidase, partial [Muribaculaceae bacterium]|nr:C10 family peptidase [Muribaculaceae bacterium]
MNLSAAPLTPEQALNRLKSSTAAKRVVGNKPFELAHTEKLNNQDYLFVFNRNNDGFIIASADDRMPALLGYSDNGAFDLATASPELKWWLGQYAVQASQSLNSVVSPLADEGGTDSSREEIPVLIKTKWNQGAPFNNDCPEDDGGKCVTGCVATAMAQVIKYHGYPSQGKGTHSYDWNKRELIYDYGNAVFDFNNMIDEYNYSSDSGKPTPTQEQEAAVANLMHACGVGVNMSYTSKESGAQDLNVAYALQKFFNYSSDIRYLDRELFSDNDWEDIVYEELKAGRPVIYGGSSNTGGHEFICDGYKDGYFHINWGWGGMSDGYFSLSVLDPKEQGIGGAVSGNGYNKSQAIICGIQPKEEGDLRSSNPFFVTAGVIGADIYQAQMLVAFTEGYLGNYYPEEIKANFYIKAIPESGGEAIYSTKAPMTFGARMGKMSFWLDMPTDLTQGDYKIFIVYKMSEGDDYCNLPIPRGMSDYIEVSVDESGSVNLKDEIKPSITASTFSPTAEVFSGEYSEFEIFISNTGMAGYHGGIYVRTFDKTTNEKLTEYEIFNNIDILMNQYISGTVYVQFNDSDNKPLPAGEYNLQC